MTLQDQKPLLPRLWERIKRFFVEYSIEPNMPAGNRLDWRVEFLERCLIETGLIETGLLETDVIEATRLQLEHQWEDVST